MLIFLLLILFLLLLVFLILPLKLTIQFALGEKEIDGSISISYLLNLINYKTYIFKLGDKPKGHTNLKLGDRKKLFINKRLIKKFWPRVKIESLKSRIIISSTDPFLSTQIYGVLWGGHGLGLGFLLQDKDIKNLDIDIQNKFDKDYLHIDFNCIIKINLVYIIHIWLKYLIFNKDGVKNEGTSHRRFNEIHNG